MERVGALETVCRYPVKSMAGEELDAAFVGFAGMMGGRAHAFVRDPGPRGFPWHTGREQEDLVAYRPRYREAAGATLPVDVERSFGMAPGVNPVFPGPAVFAVEVATPGGRTLQVGDRLRIAVLERDPRCKMISLDPDAGREDSRVLRHVTKAHGGTAGVYAAVLVEGVVRKGDPIWLV